MFVSKLSKDGALGCGNPGSLVPASHDEDLVQVGESKDRVAFERLFDFFAPRLKSYLRGLKATEDVCDDIVQDVMVTVWRQAPQFDPRKAGAATWIFTIARNRRIDLFRRDRKEYVEFNESHQPETAPSAFEFMSSVQASERLREAIDRLPAKQAQLLRIFYFEDKTHTEIANEMAVPLGTVKSRLRLAINKLRSSVDMDLIA